VKYGYVYGKTYQDVKIKRDLAIERIKENDKRNAIISKDKFSKAILDWLDTKLSIKDSTRYNYYFIIKSKIIPYFKNVKIRNIDEQLVLNFIKGLQKSNLSNRRIKDVMILLNQFLKYNNVYIKYDLPKIKKINIITLTEEEINIIRKDALKTNNIQDFSIFLVLYTGLRIGELCALQWNDIDLDNQVIHISKTISRIKGDSNKKTKLIITSPKTETSIRDVPIHNKILPHLKKFQKEGEIYLVTSTNKYISTNEYYYYYKKYLKKLNIKKYKFHTLRHTFATRSLLNGMDIKSLSEILGHSSVKITLDKYVHIKKEEKLKQINKLPFV
jgi:integrase